MATEAHLEIVPLSQLVPHPQNPRLVLREDVIQSIAVQLGQQRSFSEMHAPIVRAVNGAYQIVAGHHRVEAAKRAEMSEIPCWVAELDENEAFMQLVLSNAQGELSPLERGVHAWFALDKSHGGRGLKGGVRAYARLLGQSKSYIAELVAAAEVFLSLEETVRSSGQFIDKAKHLAVIHQAPADMWAVLVSQLLVAGWSVEETVTAVKRVKALFAVIPDWWTSVERLSLAAKVVEQEDKGLLAMFTLAAQIADGFEPVTIYHQEETEMIEERHGRQCRLWRPVAVAYDPGGDFRRRLLALPTLPDRQAVTALQEDILKHIQLFSQATEHWRPIMTDEEWQAERQRQAELAALERQRRYTPTLTHADVLDGLRQVATFSVDLICTDPPYNMGKAAWDVIPNYGPWAEQWLRECYRVLKPGGSLYVFGRLDSELCGILLSLKSLGFTYHKDIVWDTVQGAGGGLWPTRHEIVLYATKGEGFYADAESVRLERHEAHIREYKGVEWDVKKPGDVWRFPCVDDKSADRTDLPVQKPKELLERIIKASCPRDGLVLDCFIGSGSTGVACMRLQRRCIGIDNAATSLEVARGRFKQTEIGAAL